MRAALFLLGLAAGLSACASRATPPDVIAAGRRIGQRNCIECHAVDPGQISRMAEAPAFPVLYKTYPVQRLAEAMEKDEFTGMPHMRAFDLDSDERAQLQAYLISFRP